MSGDKGWVFNEARQAWELLDSRGDLVFRVTVEFVDRAGAAEVNRKGDQIGNRWPPLLPGRAYIQCVLTDGPLAGTFVFLDPRKYDGPPGRVEMDLEQPLPGMPDGPGPAPEARVRPAMYLLARQACGHGNACPWPYTFDPAAEWQPPDLAGVVQVPLPGAAGPVRLAAVPS